MMNKMTYHFNGFKNNYSIHWIPNLMLFSVRFPTVKRISIRGSFMFLNFGIEMEIDFKTK